MKSLIKFSAIAVGMSLLAACGTYDIDSVGSMTPKGGAFNIGLHHEYVELARAEGAESDWTDASYFLGKATSAANGEDVQPDAIESRRLPAGKATTQLSLARQALMNLFEDGGKKKAPGLSAQAQASFDCWMQEQEENHQPKDIAACRDRFYKVLGDAADAIRPKMAMMAASKPVYVDGQYIVFFDLDSASVNAGGAKEIAKIITDYRIGKPAKILVEGHTDLSGSIGYNAKLADNRAKTVAKALSANGIPAGVIDVVSFGEKKPLRPTPDGKEEKSNRRVEVTFE